MPGCIGSMDVTHIYMHRCYSSLRNLHKGKEGFPTRAYQIAVNHRRQILSCSSGFFGSYNDKTISSLDDFALSIRDNEIYRDFEWNIHDQQGNILKRKGVWLAVDNGYHRWVSTISPMKETSNLESWRWSKWIEGIRKDVECTFGILKGRFRILKNGFRVHNLETTDNIFKTCCALHNMLLEVDGLDLEWKEGVKGDYELEYEDGNEIPIQILKVNTDDKFSQRRYELINHFNYKWINREVEWPSRNGKVKSKIFEMIQE